MSSRTHVTPDEFEENLYFVIILLPSLQPPTLPINQYRADENFSCDDTSKQIATQCVSDIGPWQRKNEAMGSLFLMFCWGRVPLKNKKFAQSVFHARLSPSSSHAPLHEKFILSLFLSSSCRGRKPGGEAFKDRRSEFSCTICHCFLAPRDEHNLHCWGLRFAKDNSIQIWLRHFSSRSASSVKEIVFFSQGVQTRRRRRDFCSKGLVGDDGKAFPAQPFTFHFRTSRELWKPGKALGKAFQGALEAFQMEVLKAQTADCWLIIYAAITIEVFPIALPLFTSLAPAHPQSKKILRHLMPTPFQFAAVDDH